MDKEMILELIKDKVVEILPEIDRNVLTEKDSLKALGANSMDRFDIIVDTMEDLGINTPLVDFNNMKNIGEIAQYLFEKQA